MNVDLINQRLKDHNAVGSFDALMKKCTWLIALSFIVSAFLNYFLSRWIVVTEPSVDKIAFNDQVGQMMGWSFPVISIPCMLITLYALKILTGGIKEIWIKAGGNNGTWPSISKIISVPLMRCMNAV